MKIKTLSLVLIICLSKFLDTVSHDHIAGSSVELIEVGFFKFTADQVMEIYWIAGSSISQIIRTKLKIRISAFRLG